jgi:hypothetical protein
MRVYGLLEMRWTVGAKGATPDIFRGEVDVAIGRKTLKKVRLASTNGEVLVGYIRYSGAGEVYFETCAGNRQWVTIIFRGVSAGNSVSRTAHWKKNGSFAPWSGTFWKTGESQ